MKLLVMCLNEFATNVYQPINLECNLRADSGYDLYCCSNHLVEPWAVQKIPLGIACQPVCQGTNLSGYYLYPRSSISKTPLGLANSVGIIDYGYRGEICAVVRNYSNTPYQISQGDKLFQLCVPDLTPWEEIQIVNKLDESIRGTGGFGSTDLK